MKKLISVLCAIVIVVTSFSFVAFAASKDEANDAVAALNKEFNKFIEERFDADGSGGLNAGDARAILLYSAGLKADTATIDNSDADGDGRVTALDARLVLRLSALLDSPSRYYSNEQKLEYFNAIINSVKPNKYNYYGMNISSTDAVTYSDPSKVIKSIDDQVNKWEKLTGEHMDLGAELTQTDTVYQRFSLAGRHIISDANFPIYYEEYASILTADNIERIEYNKNQTYTFVHYKTNGEKDYSESVAGLDSITAYIKTDAKMTTIPDDVSTLNHGKIFNVLEQSDIDSILDSSGLGSMDGMEDLGKFDVTPGFNNVKYYNSFVTIYFDHNTGAAIGVDYSLHYDMSIKLKMDINISLTGEGGNFFAIKAKGDVDLTSTMTEKNSYYFTDNNPNHVPAA